MTSETLTALGSVVVQTVLFLTTLVFVKGDTPVGCVFGGICVLPCRFQPNGDKIIHWIKIIGGTLQVHSYYDDQDQLGHQDPLYEGRTSLFHDQISGGNASLGLARVNLQDQGRYQCYASTTHFNQETFVTLTVTAPVTKVDIVLGNNTVTCQSRGIYPRPQLTWSVSNHPATVLQNTTEVHEDDRGLYDISGSLRTIYSDTESTYSCSVHNEHSARKATMRLHPPMQSAPRSEVLLPCNASRLDDITWTFNHNQTILRRQAGQEEVVETEWQQHVRDLSESGSLLLYVTSSAQSEGTYRCTLRYADGEDVTHIELKILQNPIAEGSNRTHWITLGVFLAAILSVIIIWRKTVKQRNESHQYDHPTMFPDAREGTSGLPSSPLLLPLEPPAGQATSSPPAPSSETQLQSGVLVHLPMSPAAGEGTSGLPSSPLLSTELPAGQATSSTTSSTTSPSSDTQPAGLTSSRLLLPPATHSLQG